MSFFKQFGKLASGFNAFTTATTTTLITPGADEWVDIYNIVISTNDTAQQQVTIDDSTNTIGVYFVGGGAGNATVLDLSTIPVRGKKAGAIRATVASITGAKTIAVKVVALISKT